MAASSKHHVRNRILGGLGAVILIVVGFFMWQKTKVQLYDDPNTTGNTAGNLLNGGKFCEADGRIYYADPYDNDSLYVTDDKLQKSTKLHGDTVSYLNVAGDYIFYTRRNDRKSVTGGNVLALIWVSCMMIRHSLCAYTETICIISITMKKRDCS